MPSIRTKCQLLNIPHPGISTTAENGTAFGSQGLVERPSGGHCVRWVALATATGLHYTGLSTEAAMDDEMAA